MLSKHGVRWEVVLLVLAAACAGKPAADAAKSEAAPAAATPPVVTIVAHDYAYQAPDTFPAGVVRLRLEEQGKEMHHVTVARLDSGKTVADIPGALASGRLPGWMVMLGGPNAAVPGGSSEADVTLTPGNYILICLIPSVDGLPHAAKGMIKPFTVAGPATVASLPEADVTIRLTDYDFTLSQPLSAGHHVIRVETDASQTHELLLARVNEGKTALELAQWAEKPVGPPPGLPVGGVTAIAPGGSNVFEVNLEPGDYALICFMPDAKDGKPHYVHGMIKQVKVS
jgi:uncharacterized cupredoxin-like copper-binding protein